MSASGVLISYREDDAKSPARMLAEELAETFGAEHVFLDKDTQGAGDC